LLVYGALLLVVMRFESRGIAGLASSAIARLRS
jgi:hypothetical protein